MTSEEHINESQNDDNEDFKLDGPIKRNLHILLPIVIGFLVAPPLTRLMQEYRAVVLSRSDGELLIMEKDRPPELIGEIEVEPGQMVCKEAGSWNPSECPKQADDSKLEELYTRYTSSFVGRIVGINPPLIPGGASSAVVLLENKKKIEIELWAQHLAGAKVGLGLKKNRESWEPRLVADPFAGNIHFQAPQEKGTPEQTKN
ncbi:MAG: hypothetical protein CMH60_04670 [Myxococcales bacterium]|nr:hypothetical protein [Myxococcales bacterium]|tara:strand:- start:206 stop:811 length:606 start_codon:yes stop_codon:yes gene_type:complete